MNSTKRVAEHRKLMRKQGYILKQMWSLPKYWEQIKKYVEKLHNQ